MNKNQTQLLSIIKTALKIESDGSNFYSMAAGGSSNPSAKQIFDFLSDEEKKHYSAFLQYYKALENNKLLDFKSTIDELNYDSKESNDLFNHDFIKRLAGDNHSLSSVSIGVQLEQKSIAFYKGWVAKSSNKDEKDFLKILIDAEIGHHDFLAGIEKELLGESWDTNNFSPF